MYDLCIGSNPGGPSGAVVLTIVDRDAATRLLDAIQKDWSSVFQVEGLRPFLREVERIEAPVVIPASEDPEAIEYYKISASTAINLIREQIDATKLLEIESWESVHPRFDQGGRRTVRNAIQERLGELAVPDVEIES